MQDTMFGYPNLDVRAGSVFDLVFDHTHYPVDSSCHTWARVKGVRLRKSAHSLLCEKNLSLSSSTPRFRGDHQLFSGGCLHWDVSFGRDSHRYPLSLLSPASWSHELACSVESGLKRIPAGRMNEAPSVGLSESLRCAGFRIGRLQIGTPARLDRKTINFERLEAQYGECAHAVQLPEPNS